MILKNDIWHESVHNLQTHKNYKEKKKLKVYR